MLNKINKSNIPLHLKGKSDRIKNTFVDTVNSCIDKGMNYSLSIQEANSAVKQIEQQEIEQREKERGQQVQLIKQNIKDSLKSLPLNFPKPLEVTPLNPSSEPTFADDVKKVFFDKQGRLVIVFDDDSRVISSNPIPTDYIEQHIAVQVNPVFDYVRFNTDITETATLPHEEGLLFYDKSSYSLSYYNEDSNVKVDIGQEQIVRVYNNSTNSLLLGKVVWVSGAVGGYPVVEYANASLSEHYYGVLGVVTAEIPAYSHGYVCVLGKVTDVDTSMFSAGETLYLDTTLGEVTNILPVQPYYAVIIGKVLTSDTNGKILVYIDRRDWFPNLNLIENTSNIVLPDVPTPIKPSITNRNEGFTYDNLTGEITFLEGGNYSLVLQLNATPSASNKNIYFYSEEYVNGSWVINKNTARMVRLVNQVEDQINIVAARYVKANTKFRFNVWGDNTIILNSTNLPGTTPGTVVIPAIRLTLA